MIKKMSALSRAQALARKENKKLINQHYLIEEFCFSNNLIYKQKMESCIKGLFDLDNPKEWALCVSDTNCLCHSTIDDLDNECVTDEVIRIFCGVSKQEQNCKCIIFILKQITHEKTLEKERKCKKIESSSSICPVGRI